MKKFFELNIMDDDSVMNKLSWSSIGLMVIFAFLFYVLAINIRSGTANSFHSNPFVSVLTFLVLYFVLIVIHELIHGLFFKLFSPKDKVTFGFNKFAAYASSPNTKYSRGKFSVIILAPFVFITLALTLLYAYEIIGIMGYVLLAAAHAGACVGDFYFMILIFKHGHKESLIEDTATGFIIYENE